MLWELCRPFLSEPLVRNPRAKMNSPDNAGSQTGNVSSFSFECDRLINALQPVSAVELKVCVPYLRVRGRSVLDVELQSPQSLCLLDEVRGVQSHVLMEDLKVLAGGKRQRLQSQKIIKQK